MEKGIIELALTQGLWAVLFVFLLFWVLRENARREENYQSIISKLSDNLCIVEDIKKDVDSIKGWIDR